jgi:hypothetical protein
VANKRVRTKRREHRVELLSAWLAWANDRDSSALALHRRFIALVNATTGVAAGGSPQLEELRWVQEQALAAFAFCATAAPDTEHEVASWRPGAPAPRFVITKGLGATARYEGSIADVGRLALCAVLMHPELRRITRCVVRGCGAPLVARKRGLYCAEHGKANNRSRRHYAKFSPEERRERRRKLYLEWNRIHQPDHYRELLAIEAARHAEPAAPPAELAED